MLTNDSALAQAISDMAYDNGVINVNTSEAFVLTKVLCGLEKQFSEDDLRTATNELDGLDDEEFENLNGDEADMPGLQPITRAVLDAAFDLL